MRDWFAAGSAISGQVEANSSQPGYKRLLHAGSTCPFCNYGMRLIGHYPSTSVEVWACSWCRYHQEQPCLELNEDSAPPLR